MSSFNDAIVVRAVQTTATFVLVVLTGAWLANHPKPPNQLLDPTTLSKLSRIVMGVVAPALVVATVGDTVTQQTLEREGWVLIVWSLIFMSECCAVALAVAAVAGVPSWFKVEFVLSLTFPNALAAPLVMMATMCRQVPFAGADFAEPDADESVSCEDQSLTYLFIYTTGWILVFFAFGLPHTTASTGAAGDTAGWLASARRRLQGATNINVLALAVGLLVALVGPLNYHLYSPEGGLLWLSSAAVTIGGPLVGLSSLVVGGTLGQTIRRVYLNRRDVYLDRRASRRESALMAAHRPWAAEEQADKWVENPVFGDAGDSNNGDGVFGSSDGNNGDGGGGGGGGGGGTSSGFAAAAPPVALSGAEGGRTRADSRSGATGTPPPSGEGGDAADGAVAVKRPTARLLVLLVLCRMVLCPLVCGATLMLGLEATLPSAVPDLNAKLIKVLLMLEAIVPSADFVIVACIQGGHTAGAEALSVTYLWQYLVGVVTMTAGVAVAAAWI